MGDFFSDVLENRIKKILDGFSIYYRSKINQKMMFYTIVV